MNLLTSLQATAIADYDLFPFAQSGKNFGVATGLQSDLDIPLRQRSVRAHD
jgi:hypothetical protein